MARGYLDHEAGHVRDTDFQALKDASLSPLEKHVWNTLEDYRVEHKLASIFPGCRQNFDWLIAHIFGAETQDELPNLRPSFSTGSCSKSGPGMSLRFATERTLWLVRLMRPFQV